MMIYNYSTFNLPRNWYLRHWQSFSNEHWYQIDIAKLHDSPTENLNVSQKEGHSLLVLVNDLKIQWVELLVG